MLKIKQSVELSHWEKAKYLFAFQDFMTKKGIPDSGIVLQASRDLIRKAAQRVLTDFTMFVEDSEGNHYSQKESIAAGDSIVFKENMDICPAIVIATLLEENLWFVMTTAECPRTRCDDMQAMKCARLNDQNLRILREFVTDRKEAKMLTEWQSGFRDPSMLEKIIDRTTHRWTH